MNRRFRSLFGAAALCLAAATAAAHVTNVTTGEVAIGGQVVAYRLTLSAHDLAVALGIETDLIAPVPQAAFDAQRSSLEGYFRRRISVTAQGAACAPEPAVVDYGRLPDDLVVDLAWRCPAPVERLGIAYGLFFDIDASHRSIGKIATPVAEEEFLFDATLNRIEFDVASESAMPPLQRFWRMLVLGVEHILIGYDHLLFLVALVIGHARFWSLVKIVTAFTVAHSITLSLAWFGIVALPSRWVESAIALSIAYVAGENLLGRQIARRWLLAFGLGLVHGLGFYGVLSELELARGHAVTTLLAFNLGVEVGQLAVMGLLFGMLAWSSRQRWFSAGARVASAAILAIAGWWVIERALLA